MKNSVGWKTARLDNLVDRLTNGYVGATRGIYQEQGIPYLLARHIKSNNLQFDGRTYVTEEFNQQKKKSILKTGDILLVQSGHIGESAVVPPKHQGHNCHALIVITPKHEKLDSNYLSRYFSSSFGKAQFRKIQTGITLKHLNCRDVKKLAIPLPPLEEQKRIAAILDKADAIRRSRQKAIALTEELLRSTFLDMFGDPVTNPKGWNVKKLGDITTKITDGVHQKPNYTNSGVPFISVKDITTGTLKFGNCKFISEQSHQKYFKRCNPEFGDILYTKVGATYGRPALVNVHDEFSLYVSVCLIKPIKDIVRPHFLKEAMATPAIKRQADRSIKGIGVPDLHLNMIRQFLVPVPDLKFQDDFLKKAEQIHKLQSTAKQHFLEAENIFNSLLQKAFRGEL